MSAGRGRTLRLALFATLTLAVINTTESAAVEPGNSDLYWSCTGVVKRNVGGQQFDIPLEAKGANEKEARGALMSKCMDNIKPSTFCLNLQPKCSPIKSVDSFTDGYDHFFWCGHHEGMRFFADDNSMRPANDLRAACMQLQEHEPEHRKLVGRMTDDDIARAVKKGVDTVSSAAEDQNLDLEYNLTWCNRKKSKGAMTALAAKGDWLGIRRGYAQCQNNNLAVMNVPAVVPNDMLIRIAACSPKTWPYDRKKEGFQNCPHP